MKAFTASASTTTLVSLPIGPFLHLLTCAASKNHLAIWPNTAAHLLWRMAPSPGIKLRLATHLHGISATHDNGTEGVEEGEKRAKEVIESLIAETFSSLTRTFAAELGTLEGLQKVCVCFRFEWDIICV